MITDPQLMPDFREGLEQALYRRASLPAHVPARGRTVVWPRAAAWQAAVASAALAAVAAVILVIVTGGGPSHEAYAGPQVLTQPLGPVPAGLVPGPTARATLGQDVRFEGAIAIGVSGGTAYALRAQNGWCLTTPLNVVGEAPVGVGCARDSAVEYAGLAVALGSLEPDHSSALAIVPPGALPPTIEPLDGPARSIEPSSSGVVSIEGLQRGDGVVLHGADGFEQMLRVP